MNISCPNCRAEAAVAFTARDENRRLSLEAFRYCACPACGLVFLADIPDDLGAYYREEYYEIPTRERLEAVGARTRFRIELLRRLAGGQRLLEIGPAFGVLSWQAKQAGFLVDAIEMDARCCKFLREVVGINAVESADPAAAVATMEPHDVIVLWHVIEHLRAPLEVLPALAGNLAPGGILVIATPNPAAWQFAVMGRCWPHVDAPRHTMLIPPEVLRTRLSALGLEQIHFSSDDADARSWNRFGWQRLLMNRMPGKWTQRLAFAAGWLLSLLVAPFDRRRGSAYTIAFKKVPVS